ncbi:MAG TPA: UvrD-helicase domain-containing protein [Candidatus Dormibacteraeota bacterium]
MTRTPVDQAQRARLVSDLDITLFVEAGAGTGKTTAVVSRIVAFVAADRLSMERLVAITFTVAASGELRVQIREGLERAAGDVDRPPVARDRCAVAASEVERARIETIHAFCSALLSMHPLEAGLPPDFETLAELSATIDVRERFRRWFAGLVPGDPASEAVRRGLLLGITPASLLALFGAFDANWDLLAAAPPWEGQLPGGLILAVRRAGDELASAIARIPDCHTPDKLSARLEALRPVALRLQGAATVDEALAALILLHLSPNLNVGSADNWRPGVCKAIKDAMREVREQATGLVTASRTAVVCGIARTLRDVVLAYADERRARGLVSYQDLLVRARNLVRDHAAVRDALRHRWDVIVVDEFQDTDPLQAELAFLLSGRSGADADRWPDLALRPGALCVVGDPKQSIYRFRRADMALYAAVEEALTLNQIDARASLQVNFRSGRRIVEAVNAVFGGAEGLMRAPAQSGVQATYVDLIAHAPEIDGAVHVFGEALDVRAPEMWRQEASSTAAIVKRILAEGWSVGDGTDEGPHPCRASDLCILMPSRTNLRNLERALEGAQIPYGLESGSLMVATQEVRDLLNCLRAIDDPTDQVALVAALRSPAYGCSDVDLLHWREGKGRWSYERPGDADGPRVAAAMSDLREMHGMRHTLSVAALVETLISRRLLRAAAAADWRPRETLRRQRYLLDQVRALGRTGRATLHDAVEHLERLSRDPHYDSVIADADDEDCVRVMTIHAAKGLEFPVVLVTGLGRKPPDHRAQIASNRADGRVEVQVSRDFATSGWAELEARETAMHEAERVRLLYVALTRPRDHLIISRYRTLNAGDKTDIHALDMRLRTVGGIAVLDPAYPPTGAVRPAVPVEVEMDPEAHRRAEDMWMARRAELVAGFSSLRATTATAVAHEPDEPSPDASGDVAARRRGRGGTSLGRAVHAVLQVIDLQSLQGNAGHAAVQAAAEAIPERALEVERLVRAACSSEAVRRAAASRHWRELPVGATVDGVIVEGFIDLLYEDPDGRLVVLDYKTDAVTAGGVDARLDRYRLQGGAYALLTRLATGREVARIEFVFAAAGQTRTITDIDGVVAEVRSVLAGGGA